MAVNRKPETAAGRHRRSRRASPVARAAQAGPARRPVEAMLAELKQRLLDISDLNAAASVLGWDQSTYMPPGGAPARGRQLAVLRRLAHERSVDPALGKLLDALEPHAGRLLRETDASLIRVARRDFEKASKLPPKFVARFAAHTSESYDAWTRARPADDFASMRPYLEKTVELSREYAGYFAPYESILDPFIDDADEGLTAAAVRKLFAALKRELLPLLRAIVAQPPVDTRCLEGRFPEPAQLAFSHAVVKALGYDFARGRLDKTPHPFCTRFAHGDVRITTRVNERDLGDALFSSIHEAGHALYEQGVDQNLDGTPLGSGVSAGIHESQSRLWENLVARSEGFWRCFYPLLQEAFGHFRSVPFDAFVRAINKVERSLIRTDADEVTYNLHIMLRFDLELDLLEGRLQVKDLPEAWRAAMQADLGLTPPDDRNGCLQDVHWYAGSVGGAFHSYTIGNILSAQFMQAALAAHPEIPREIESGRFATLHGWLRENLYRHGRKYPPDALIRRATGKPLTVDPYLAYLREKFGKLYNVSLGSLGDPGA
ncbi:MAG TPA: carboxypeptidase M32 [Xanthobacteraceae bacterium]|nr:carboxypeptidase M32 [Xanthobacteraceae bacterium]